MSNKFNKLINQLSSVYDIDSRLIQSVIQCESSFNPDAISSMKAKGLMQLTDLTFKHVRIKYKKKWTQAEIFTPEINIEAGIIYLKELIKSCSLIVEAPYVLHYALASYQAGPTNVRKALVIIKKNGHPKNWESLCPHLRPNTIRYVEKVLKAIE